MESIFKLGILLTAVDQVSGPIAKMGKGMDGLKGRVLGLGPAFNKFKTYGLFITTVTAGILNMMSGAAMATVPAQKALGELSSVGVQNLSALDDAGASFSDRWSGTTKAQFIAAAYDIKSGISSLSDEGVAEFTKLAAVTGKATKSTTAEMTSLFATGYGIYKDMYENLSDMQFGTVFSAGISASVKNFKTTGSGMAQAISQLGASATSAKIPLSEQLSILGMLQATMTGSEAGTKYKALMQSAAGAGEKLNLQFLDANNQLLSMPEILKSLQGKYGSTLDAMEKMEIQKAFGTQEAVAVIDLLYGKVGDLETNIVSLNGAMGEGTSFTERMAAAMNIDIGAGGALIAQQWSNLVTVVGEQLIPVLVPLFAWIGTIIVAIRKFAKSHDTLTRVAVLAATALASLIFVLGGLAAVLGTVGLFFPKVGAGMAAIGKGFAFLKTGIISATTSVWGFTTALLANPVTWVVLAVMALGAALYFLYQKCEIVKTGIDKMLYVLGYLLGAAIKTGKGLWEAICHPMDFIKSIFYGVAQAISSLINWFKSLSPEIQSIAKLLLSFVFPPLAIAFNWDAIKNGIGKMLSWITGKIPEFLASGKALWGAFTGGIKSTLSAPADLVRKGFGWIGNLIPHSDAKEGPLSTLTLSGARMMETIGAGIQSAAPGLVKGVAGVMAGVAAVTVIGSGIQSPPMAAKDLSFNSEKLKQVAAKSSPTQARVSEKKEYHIHINGLKLDNVNDGNSFIAELLKLAGGMMTDGYLSIEHGQVKLAGQLVPGILVSMDIDGSVRFDSAEVDNLSGKKKTPLGWEDALINLSVALLTDEAGTCYEKLSRLNSIFKGLDNNANPKVYDIVNSHALARGVSQVVFKGLKSSESSTDDVILAALGFDEHNPPTIPPEIRKSAGDSKKSPAPAANSGSVVADPVVTADPDSPWDEGFKAGIS